MDKLTQKDFVVLKKIVQMYCLDPENNSKSELPLAKNILSKIELCYSNSKDQELTVLEFDISLHNTLEYKTPYAGIVKSFHNHFCKECEKIKGEGRISKNLRNATFNSWYDCVRKMFEVDKITLNEIRIVYKFLTSKTENESKDFWNNTISSVSGLRKHFDKIQRNAHSFKQLNTASKPKDEKSQVIAHLTHDEALGEVKVRETLSYTYGGMYYNRMTREFQNTPAV